MSHVQFLDALADVSRGNRKIPQANFLAEGDLAVVDQGQSLIAGYTDELDAAVKTDGPLIVFGDHTRTFKYVDFPFAMGADGVKVLKVREGFHSKFVYHYLAAREIPSAGYSRHFKFLKELEVPKPAMSEQRRIVAILDHADALRAKRRQVLAHLDELTQSIFHDRFGRFRDWQWPTAQVREVGLVQLGRQRAPKYQTGEWPRPYLRVANVQMDWLKLDDVLTMDFDPKDFEAYRLEVGDVLLNEGQNTEFVGRPAIWRGEIAGCCFQNTLVRFQPDRTRVTSEFAQHVFLEFLRAGQFARISSKTSNVAHLGKERFARMDMPLPPLEAQAEFSVAVDSVRRQRHELVRANHLDDELFASLQSRAFRGEL